MKPLAPLGATALAVSVCAASLSGGSPRLAATTEAVRRSASLAPTNSCAPASPAPTERRWYRRQAVPGPGTLLRGLADLVDPACAQQEQQAPDQQPPGGTPGAATLRDAYFPNSGNGGYDVTDYNVDLTYQPSDQSIDSTVTITANALQDLSSFDLDFRGPRVLSVTVDGAPATFRRVGTKLIVTPHDGLSQNHSFTTVVHYAGVPGAVGNPDMGTYGWVPSRDGAVVVSEPDGAPTWLPVNDHPSDKATYTFRITVPKDLQVLANGEPETPEAKGAQTTYVWHERMPMASYLASIAIGHFKIRKGTTATGLPVITAVDPRFASAANHLYATTVAAVTWESSVFGRYPFTTVGGIIDDPRLDYALETQERPVYAGFAPDDDFIVHELAHQWFGDSVSLTKWQDIWLNEGFATYAEWLWHERTGKDSAKKTFKRYYVQPSNSPLFNPPPGRPGRDQLFSFSVYIRGAMCLQALRDRVGSPTFFKILKEWAADHRYGNATTAQFETLAESLSHQHLAKLFDAWLTTKGKPKHW